MPKNLDRVVGNEIHREELKLGESVGRKTGGPGACPRENFPLPRPSDRWKTPNFWSICHERSKRSRLVVSFPKKETLI